MNEAEAKVSRAQAQHDRPEKLVKAKRELASKQYDQDKIEQQLQAVQPSLGE